MPPKLVWTDAQDTTIRRMRAEGAPWDAIAELLRMTRYTVIQRGRLIGAQAPPSGHAPPRDDPNRDPLRPGDPRTWDPLVRDTFLDGVSYADAVATLWPAYRHLRSYQWNTP